MHKNPTKNSRNKSKYNKTNKFRSRYGIASPSLGSGASSTFCIHCVVKKTSPDKVGKYYNSIMVSGGVVLLGAGGCLHLQI